MTDDPFAGLDMTQEDVEKALERSSWGRKDRDYRVCICGHLAGAHTQYEYLGKKRLDCSVGKLKCPCEEERYVLKTTNTRFFQRKTIGRGYDHALMLGMMKALSRGYKVEWLEPRDCDICGGEPVQPVPFRSTGQMTDEPGARNKLLCRNCIRDVAANAGYWPGVKKPEENNG